MAQSKGKRGAFEKQLLRDAASDFVGLTLTTLTPGIWVPASIAITLGGRALSSMRGAAPTFVHWDMDGGRLYRRYAAHQQSLVTVQYGSESWHVPSVLEHWIGSSETSLRASRVDSRFRLDAVTRACTAEGFDTLQTLLRERHFVDGPDNVRLREITADGRGRPVLALQRTDYFNYARTNLLMDYRAQGAIETLRERVHPDGRLEPLAESPLGNLLGVNTLLFTVDGDLIVPMRSKKAIFRPGEYTPSSSGTVEWIDIRRGRLDLLRESVFELGIRRRHLAEPLTVLAITRELVRGGQPELFCFGHLKVGRKEIEKRILHSQERDEIQRERGRRSEVPRRRIEFFQFGTLAAGSLAAKGPDRELTQRQIRFDERFTELLDFLGPLASVPLTTNLALWWDYRRGVR